MFLGVGRYIDISRWRRRHCRCDGSNIAQHITRLVPTKSQSQSARARVLITRPFSILAQVDYVGAEIRIDVLWKKLSFARLRLGVVGEIAEQLIFA